jgi:hypothetical protein
MTNKNKKIVIYSGIAIIIIAGITFQYLNASPRKAKTTQTVPLIPENKTSTNTSAQTIIQVSPVVPKQTNLSAIVSKGSPSKSETEIQKIKSSLPITIKDFETSTKQKTTVSIFSLPSDPVSVLRIEVYGINFNNPQLDQIDAQNFKESFVLAKKALTSRGINVNNLQIIYGNRQYIQDTASYWVSAFGLLN